MFPHEIGGKQAYKVDDDRAGNHPQAGEMGFAVGYGGEEAIQVGAENAIGKTEKKLQDEDGNPEGNHDEHSGAELLFQMSQELSHNTLPLAYLHYNERYLFCRQSQYIQLAEIGLPEAFMGGKPALEMCENRSAKFAYIMCNTSNHPEHSS